MNDPKNKNFKKMNSSKKWYIHYFFIFIYFLFLEKAMGSCGTHSEPKTILVCASRLPKPFENDYGLLLLHIPDQKDKEKKPYIKAYYLMTRGMCVNNKLGDQKKYKLERLRNFYRTQMAKLKILTKVDDPALSKTKDAILIFFDDLKKMNANEKNIMKNILNLSDMNALGDGYNMMITSNYELVRRKMGKAINNLKNVIAQMNTYQLYYKKNKNKKKKSPLKEKSFFHMKDPAYQLICFYHQLSNTYSSMQDCHVWMAILSRKATQTKPSEGMAANQKYPNFLQSSPFLLNIYNKLSRERKKVIKSQKLSKKGGVHQRSSATGRNAHLVPNHKNNKNIGRTPLPFASDCTWKGIYQNDSNEYCYIPQKWYDRLIHKRKISDFERNEVDSLWEIISKTYFKIAYPRFFAPEKNLINDEIPLE